jgi:hypothetical protein
MKLEVKINIGDQSFTEEEAKEIFLFLRSHFQPVVGYDLYGTLMCPKPNNFKYQIISQPFGAFWKGEKNE